MNDEIRSRLAELSRLALQGTFGTDAQSMTEAYQSLSTIDVFLKVVHTFYRQRNSVEAAQIAEFADMFCRLLIVVYRDAKKQDTQVSTAFLYSFLEDYPGVPGSCLFSKWEALGRSAYALKAVSHAGPLATWEQSKNLFQAYNEFLNGLLGFLIVGWRCALGRRVNSNVITNAYGAKLNDFRDLTGGLDGAFEIIFKLAHPEIRNAIAHGDIWLDTASNGLVKHGNRGHQTGEIPYIDFLGFAMIGSHLGEAYLTAIATILVIENGSDTNVAQLPQHLVRVFNHH